MFVDLDWPLNASSLLSASAELLVKTLFVQTFQDCFLGLYGAEKSLNSSVSQESNYAFPRLLWFNFRTYNSFAMLYCKQYLITLMLIAAAGLTIPVNVLKSIADRLNVTWIREIRKTHFYLFLKLRTFHGKISGLLHPGLFQGSPRPRPLYSTFSSLKIFKF